MARCVRLISTYNRAMSAVVLPFDPSAAPITVASVEPKALWKSTPSGEKPPKVGITRTFFNTPQGKTATLVSLGDKFSQKKGDERSELVRKSVGAGIKELKNYDGVDQISVDASSDPHAAAVAAFLAQYKFSLKTSPPSQFDPNLKEITPDRFTITPLEQSKEWDSGVIYAEAQNLARTATCRAPGQYDDSNGMYSFGFPYSVSYRTTQIFTERIKKELEGVPNVEIFVRDEAWAQEKNMNTFLSVTHGTSEPAKILEIHYKGAADKSAPPVAFVGKGITFDSGGISLKPGNGMKLMRGDMGGAAAVASAAIAIAKLKLNINLIVVTPLTENMPGPSATKPGDIVYAMNGKSVEIDNTDAEGRLVLADAIYYTITEYKPHTLIDVATLTGACVIALGEVYSAVYSTSDELWEHLRAAGEVEYDRFWRMPLDDDYLVQIHGSNADLQNTGGRPAGSITAALFLKAFAEGAEPKDESPATLNWAHIDIAGTMEATRSSPYQEKGMTGRPVRALIEYIRRLLPNA